MANEITRRRFVSTLSAIKAAPAPVLLTAAPGLAAQATSQGGSSSRSKGSLPVYLFLNSTEAQFIEAACERLIPADELGPGALRAGVNSYFDKQLGGAWAAEETPVPDLRMTCWAIDVLKTQYLKNPGPLVPA